MTSLLSLDSAARLWLASHHAPVLDQVMLAVSAIGRGGFIWVILGTLLTIRRPAAAAGVWQVAIAVFLAAQLTDLVVKPAVGRVRPYTAVMDVRVIGERPKTFSFPSGHAATAFAGALALGRVWRRARPVLWSFAALIALSRVYVGVHYPLDVLGGALLGLACAYFAVGGPAVRRAEITGSGGAGL